MSIVIEFYPDNASKEDLTDFFKLENFQKCNYFLKPFPNGTIYLSWFEHKDYKSIDGLEAVIYPDKENASKGWSVYTRTRVWASAYDKQKQNEVIKKLRLRMGESCADIRKDGRWKDSLLGFKISAVAKQDGITMI